MTLRQGSRQALILASKSASRQAMLGDAGVEFEAIPADIDERAIETGLAGRAAPTIALELAKAKAVAVSADHPDRLVLGSDSLVTVDHRRFDKPQSREHAGEHLRFFSGRTMELHSGAALVRDSRIVWSTVETAELTVRKLSDAFIADYLDHEWPAVAGCVGVFRIEARGVQLFEQIRGSHFTVLGMPLMAVLAALRDHGEMPV